MTSIRRLLILSPLLLAGCSSLLNVQRTPYTVYSPHYTAPAPAANAARVAWQLVVDTPTASDTLDTSRMLAAPTPGVLEVFPGARWRDPAPALLRSLIVEGFEQSGRIVGVGNAASGVRADFSLAIELRDFQLDIRAGVPHASVRFQARLLDFSSGRVLAAQAFAQDASAAGSDAASAFAAFQTSLNAVIPPLIDWTLREGEASKQKAASR
ncbi:MAG: ABC-type transport auxiliary lipoprotein family protein [Dokdonella sp.]